MDTVNGVDEVDEAGGTGRAGMWEGGGGYIRPEIGSEYSRREFI